MILGGIILNPYSSIISQENWTNWTNWSPWPFLGPKEDVFPGHSDVDPRRKIMSLVGGFKHPSEKYDFVNWDDDSQYMGKYKMFQTTNLLDISVFSILVFSYEQIHQ